MHCFLGGKLGGRLFEEVKTYNKMLEWVDRDLQKDDMYNVEAIKDYRPLRVKDRNGKMRTMHGQPVGGASRVGFRRH